MTDADLIKCLAVVALSNRDRMKLVQSGAADWFLENVDDLAPELHRRGWVEYAEFDHRQGSVVVTKGQGDVRVLVVTDLGRAQLNAAVVS